MPRDLPQASLHVVAEQSLVVPLIIEGLPRSVEVLGQRWERQPEFHLTAIAARLIEAVGGSRPETWERVIAAASGRRLGPVTARDELRRVSHPERPSLQTLIVMADCPGLDGLHRDLSDALDAALRPPPAHVTLYSTDPGQGIGITSEAELAERAPALSRAEHAAVRRAIAFP